MKLTIEEIRARASTVLEVAELVDVRLASIECRSAPTLATGPFSVSTSLDLKGNLARGGDATEVWARYHLEADVSEESSEAGTAWSVTIEMVGTWEHSEPAEFEYFDLASFAIAVGSMTLHPYARETVQSTVGRLGYPPFTMEMLRPATALPDETEIEVGEPEADSSH